MLLLFDFCAAAALSFFFCVVVVVVVLGVEVVVVVVRVCRVSLLQNAHWHDTVWFENTPRPSPAVSCVWQLIVTSSSRFALSVFVVCLCCKMLIGVPPHVFENIPRPPLAVSPVWLLVVHIIFAFRIVLLVTAHGLSCKFFYRPLIHHFNYFALVLPRVCVERVPSALVVSTITPGTEICFCSLLMRIPRQYLVNPSCFCIFPRGSDLVWTEWFYVRLHVVACWSVGGIHLQPLQFWIVEKHVWSVLLDNAYLQGSPQSHVLWSLFERILSLLLLLPWAIRVKPVATARTLLCSLPLWLPEDDGPFLFSSVWILVCIASRMFVFASACLVFSSMFASTFVKCALLSQFIVDKVARSVAAKLSWFCFAYLSNSCLGCSAMLSTTAHSGLSVPASDALRLIGLLSSFSLHVHCGLLCWVCRRGPCSTFQLEW